MVKKAQLHFTAYRHQQNKVSEGPLVTAMALQCSAKKDTVQTAIKIHDPLKGKAYLLTSKWLGIESVREMRVAGVEQLASAK